ncbi:MEDS domain-containing protein [Planococcus rifietoensis]|uniref:MEDS domain-containing protein n=1 Tax=Planococcus rifietoensis TaxID=200991 RepID=UPI00384C7791
MEQQIPALTLKIRNSSGGHIFYLTKETKHYIDNIVLFILDGLQNNEHVLVVENTRLTPLVRKRLQAVLTAEELAQVHFFDSYKLYWHKGNFHPSTIVDYFRESFDVSGMPCQHFRTWGHIEWNTGDGLEEELLSYEEQVDDLITAQNLIAVCAYDAIRVEQHLQDKLALYHDYLMEDEEIVFLGGKRTSQRPLVNETNRR